MVAFKYLVVDWIDEHVVIDVLSLEKKTYKENILMYDNMGNLEEFGDESLILCSVGKNFVGEDCYYLTFWNGGAFFPLEKEEYDKFNKEITIW